MSNPNGYQGGGAEYGAPQYSAQPTMRPVGSQPPASYPPHVDELWGKAAAPSAPSQSQAAASPIADALAAAAASEGVVTFSRPYKAHGEDVQTIRLRRPTGRDVDRCGYPFRYVQTGGAVESEIKIVPESVSALIVALSAPPLPRSTVDSLDIRDWTACSSVVNSFFLG